MSINTNFSVTSGTSVTQNSASSSSSDTGLDVSDFLKLLVAQLSNQDPLGGSSGGGGSSTDYISQLAQFTMLQQMNNLSTSFQAGQAYSLIGKYVYIDNGSETGMLFGKVDGVVKENGINYLMVGGEAYEMSRVVAVEGEGAASDSINEQVLKSAELIGKQVTAQITNTDGEEETITGTVEKIRVNGGTIYLVIGDKEIALDSVTEISAQEATE